MKRFAIYLIILCACAQGLLSCAEGETWTHEASARLSFSNDSIVFDTLLTTVPSATKTLTVYNPNRDGIRLPAVLLQQGRSSHFRVNVDGQYLA
ncbi:MAG: right-handed parallel beta-helix repeat-containing protein, partial [Bacteroidaceae bacterium]|nr:right-handed parallel beta-helix repeat-containing protein [Bacteroidaceae bacterium]